MRYVLLFGSLLMLISCSQKPLNTAHIKRDINFNQDWHFWRMDSVSAIETGIPSNEFDHSNWVIVNLPHTPKIEPLVVNDQWQGIAWYRKEFDLSASEKDKLIFIEFEAAMQIADVWINGKYVVTHEGGYLPFTIDITKHVSFDKMNIISVRLDNRPDKNIPPGKPLKNLDFCYYGGIYRNVKMHVVEPLHISDAVLANKSAGGGIFINYSDVTSAQANFSIKTHVLNTSENKKSFTVRTHITDPAGDLVLWQETNIDSLKQNSDRHIEQDFALKNPLLWEIDKPQLYTVHSYIISENKVLDYVKTRTGPRSISFSAQGGFTINGTKRFLRGTNRHQEYPYIGNALSDEAQYRDAFKIKQAGFDYIRLSHYPQSEAFMDACDALGLVVMNCIPGWQFIGDSVFQSLCYQNIRDMIRRDRNHPSVILWEISLNESWMQNDFIEMSQKITNEELPGKYTYSCGWQKGFDVFIQARQHGGLKDYDDIEKGAVISEYGDWEYYAQNAGLDQPGFKNLMPEERNSRQLRGDGEKRMLQQAMNFQEAHNDNQKTVAAGDGLWVMFDYNRGYDTTLEASGPMDIFRLPKLAYYFFKSQRDASVFLDRVNSGPMVFIASNWTEKSPIDVRIFSNCDEVELYLNDHLIDRKKPDSSYFTSHLKHPPFTFNLSAFAAGELKAVAYLSGEAAAWHSVKTPLEEENLILEFDISGKPLNRLTTDIIFLYAKVIDKNGMVVPDYSGTIHFAVNGSAELIGENPLKAEAGIASILLKSKSGNKTITVTAQAQTSGGNIISTQKSIN